jgi:hypothetical protein
MKIYHVYRHYGSYTDRYGIDEYGYFLSKSRAEKIKYDAKHEKDSRGYISLDEIEVDETP